MKSNETKLGKAENPTMHPTAFMMANDLPPLRTDLRVPFGDGRYRFHLGLPQIEELQRVCGYTDREGNRRGIGIFALYGRLSKGRVVMERGDVDWKHIALAEAVAGEALHGDIISVIRLGLIGGGEGVVDCQPVKVTPTRATELINAYVIGRPLDEAWTLAFAILGALICGRAPDPATGE